MSVRDRFLEAFNIGVVPLMRLGGFKRKRLGFHRRQGTADQYVSFRGNNKNAITMGEWFLELGINLDEVEALKPKCLRAYVAGTDVWCWGALDRATPGFRQAWTVHSTTDPKQLAEELETMLRAVRAVLDPIDGPRPLLALLRAQKRPATDEIRVLEQVLGR